MTDEVDALFGGRTPPRPGMTERLSPQLMPDRELPEMLAGSGAYKPYGYLPTRSGGEICEVRGWVEGTDIAEGLVFQYRFMMNVLFTGNESLKIMLPDAIVVIDGRQLGDLRQKLARRLVTHIQQYHPRKWPQPPASEPFIERIAIVRPDTFKAGG